MKKSITLILATIFPLLALAQNSAIDKVFKKYEDREGFTVVTISRGLMKMVANADDDRESQEFLSRIHEIKILAEEEHTSGVNLYDEILTQLNKKDYEELMTAKSSDEEVLMLAKKNGDIVEELIILVGGKEDNALVYLSGKLNMKDLNKMSTSMNIKGAGFEHLKDIDKQ